MRGVGEKLGGLREGLLEATATGLLVAVMFASSTLRLSMGASAGRVLLGSLTLGVGFALVIWSFGASCRPQLHPFVSILMLVVRAQGWRATLGRLVAQLVGALSAALIVVAVAPAAAFVSATRVARPAFAEGVVAFLFALVVLAVAHHRDARVPLAVGAIALSSFWMTGRPTLGNPWLIGASAMVEPTSLRMLAAEVGAAACGFAVGAIVGFGVHPHARASAAALLFDPCAKGERLDDAEP